MHSPPSYAPTQYISVCQPGMFFFSGNCYPCNTGHSCMDDAMVACTPGKYAAEAGNSECTLCPVGSSLPNSGSTECIQCPVDTFQDMPGQTQCLPCSALNSSYVAPSVGSTTCFAPGKVVSHFYSVFKNLCCINPTRKILLYQPTNSPSRVPTTEASAFCPPGTFLTDQGSCQRCSSGQYCINDTAQFCQAGTYSLHNASSCTLCEPGKYQSGYGKSYCDECGIDMFQPNSGKSGCIYCSTNYGNAFHQPQTGAIDCYPVCSDGQYLPDNYQTGYAECSKCPPGSYCTDSAMSPCPNGTFSSADSQSTCMYKKTRIILYSWLFFAFRSSFASFSPPKIRYLSPCLGTSCPPGRFQQETGKSSCNLCPTYSYQPESGKDNCIPCQDGATASSQGQSLCTVPVCSLFHSTYSTVLCSCILFQCGNGIYSSCTDNIADQI